MVGSVTLDPRRRLVHRADMVAEHFASTGSPAGQGFTADIWARGTAHYGVDLGAVRAVVLDSKRARRGERLA